MNPFERRLRTIIRKNKDDVLSLITGCYPQFVYHRQRGLSDNVIPVFVLHTVEPELLYEQLNFLFVNDYHTLSANEFYTILMGKQKLNRPCVLLTFDDGWASVWTIAYPLLKHFGLKAVCFLLPHWIEERDEKRATLEDVWQNKVSIDQIRSSERSPRLCSWPEIEYMNRSGIIDFQSHSLGHVSVNIDSKVIDIVRPGMMPSFLDSDFQPIIHTSSGDRIPKNVPYGQPVYRWAPLFSEKKRYIEDYRLNEHCIRFVADHGGGDFFSRPGWRPRIIHQVNGFIAQNGTIGRFQSRQERIADMIQDLTESRKTLENRLNKPVEHLCYPWYVGGSMSVTASRAAGYLANYWGILGQKTINHIGDDPNFIARINEEYIQTLPGKGRLGLGQVLKAKTQRRLRKINNIL